MILAVLDTNVLASGTLNSSSAPGQILNAWKKGQFELVLSAHIIDELERTLKKPYFQKRISKLEVSDYIDLLKNESVIVYVSTNKRIATHPEDDFVINTALTGGADYLVTGDLRLLKKVGSRYLGINFVTPNDFLKVLQKN